MSMYDLNVSSSAICVACLSSDRNINFVNDEGSKQMFAGFLENSGLQSMPIPLCFECRGCLHRTIRFKEQVRVAHNHLLSYMKNTEPLSTLSKLCNSNVVLNEWIPENQDVEKQQNKNKSLQRNTSKRKTNTKIKEKNNSKVQDSNDDSDSNFAVDDLQDDNLHDNLQSVTLTNRNFQSVTLQENNLQKDTLQNLQLKQNNFRTDTTSMNNLKWDVKSEYVLKLDVKIEPTEEGEKRMEEYQVSSFEQEKKEDSFNDSDDEPLNNIKVMKLKKSKIKKEKKKPRERAAGVVRAPWVDKKLAALNMQPGDIDVVVLTWEEVHSEREKALASSRFTRHEFRCEHCAVGFNHRFKLDTHMKKHSQEAGDLECEVCKTRFKTNSALLCHKRRHRTRWRCVRCGGLYSRASVAADHCARAHRAAPPTIPCHLCDHAAHSLSKLRAHLRTHGERASCHLCGKTFPDKAALRTHLFIHTDQKDFACDSCDKKFRFKKALEIHQVTHQPSELLYCRECDMNFKNRISLYQHINYSMKHIHPDKIKYSCEWCGRRFSRASRLQEHRLALHLKRAPHACTHHGCGFASASRPALRTHIRMVHKHKNLERNHVCHTCGKTFTTRKILEGHIRSHTGERPFSCTTCAASFTHHAALYNHNKRVHKVPFVRRKPPPTWPAQPEGEAPPHRNTHRL